MAIDWGVTHWGVEELSLLAPVASAMVAGGLIGIERTYHGHPAGFRTHILVCMTSCVLMLAAMHQASWGFVALPEQRLVIDPTRDQSLRTIGHISYALHAIVAVGAVVPGFQPSTLLLIAAFILDLVKKDAAIGTWQESHFAWRIRSVLWAAGLYLVTAPLWLLIIPGWIAWGLISIWFLYRVVRGWLALSDRKAMPA